MADFKTPSEIGDEYLTELKALKPDIDISRTDSDWWIRSRVVGGVGSGVYADQRLIADDAFPQRARSEAILRFLDLYFQGGLEPATQAQGFVSVTGNSGATAPVGMQFLYQPNGNAYQSTKLVVMPSVTGGGQVTALIPALSVAAGQSQNLLPFAALVIPSPPAGINAAAQVASGGMADARDQETTDEARARILLRIRSPLSVGRVSDYIQYALQADPSVTSASVFRYPFGLGTVGVYITAGTTDIDAAVDGGQAISVIPSDALVATVQAYLNLNSPLTDCVSVLKPSQTSQDVTVDVSYKTGVGSTIPNGQTLTQDQLVAREVKRALYKTPVGGRKLGASGYVLMSDVAQTIDVKLSSESVEVGSIPILLDRKVRDLSASGYNRVVLPNEVIVPGNIVVVNH